MECRTLYAPTGDWIGAIGGLGYVLGFPAGSSRLQSRTLKVAGDHLTVAVRWVRWEWDLVIESSSGVKQAENRERRRQSPRKPVQKGCGHDRSSGSR